MMIPFRQIDLEKTINNHYPTLIKLSNGNLYTLTIDYKNIMLYNSAFIINLSYIPVMLDRDEHILYKQKIEVNLTDNRSKNLEQLEQIVKRKCFDLKKEMFLDNVKVDL